jgi:hypothetical protein
VAPEFCTDKWNFFLTLGTLVPGESGDHEATTAPEPHTGFQSESGPCGHQRRSNDCAACRAVRRRSQPDYGLEAQLEDGSADVFGPSGRNAAEPVVDVKALHAKIGELTLENDFLEGALNKAGLLSAKR